MTSAFVLGVDTNVLVRFLADDDDVQTPLAAKIITNASNQPIFIGIVVLTETYTVLTRVKKFPPAQVIAAMRMMLSSTQFQVEAADIVRHALDDAEEVGCGLTDAVIALQNAARGCETTATFDKRAQRLHAMVAAEDRV
jgi:predicted nucleic-acid-binding protein